MWLCSKGLYKLLGSHQRQKTLVASVLVTMITVTACGCLSISRPAQYGHVYESGALNCGSDQAEIWVQQKEERRREKEIWCVLLVIAIVLIIICSGTDFEERMKELREDVSFHVCVVHSGFCVPIVFRRRSIKSNVEKREKSGREKLVQMKRRKRKKRWTLKWLQWWDSVGLGKGQQKENHDLTTSFFFLNQRRARAELVVGAWPTNTWT